MSYPSLRWSPRNARVAAFLATALAFFGSWVLLHSTFFAKTQIVDTPVYEEYGRAIRAGDVPYRDFAVEYPPGALPVFVAPTYIGGDYAETFGWLMLAFGLCCVAIVAAGGRGSAAGFVALSPLMIGALVYSRFDFWPAALTAGALVALVFDRHRLGWGLLGAAVAAKLYPLVLLPLAIVWTLRRRGRRELGRASAIGAGVVAAAFVPFLVLAPRGLWDSISGQLTRPLQIESLTASLLANLAHPEVESSHGSQNIVGYEALAALTSVLAVAVIAALWVGFARGPADPDRLARYGAACICAFIAFGKVLSPQYLIWLIPLVTLVRGRRGFAATWLLGAALVMTQVWFPHRYWEYVERFEYSWLVLLRNLTLGALVALLVLPAPKQLQARLVRGRATWDRS